MVVLEEGKTVTLTQPWATLWVAGIKTIETRSWRTKHRGDLYVSAASGFPPAARRLCNEEPFRTALADLGYADADGTVRPEMLPRGAMIGRVRVRDCLPIVSPATLIQERLSRALSVLGDSLLLVDGDSRESMSDQLPWGDFRPGRFGWLSEANETFEQSIPVRGSLGLWTWTPNR